MQHISPMIIKAAKLSRCTRVLSDMVVGHSRLCARCFAVRPWIARLTFYEFQRSMPVFIRLSFRRSARLPAVCATLSDFTGYEDAGKSGAAGTGIRPCSASNARPLVARLRGCFPATSLFTATTPTTPYGRPSRAGPPDLGAARCVLRATPTE